MSLKLNRARFDRIVAQFPRRKVVVFGDVGVDKYTVGRVSRISPEAPIPIVEVTQTVLKLGLAANVADNIVALGGVPYLVGVIGEDRNAQDFYGLLRSARIPEKYVITDPNRMTTMKERVVAETQQVVRIDHESNRKIDSDVAYDIWNKLERAIDDAHAVIIEDYAKGLIDASICRQIIEAAEKKSIPVLVDPNSAASLNVYYGCTIITPNTAEAEMLSGVKICDFDSLALTGQRILDKANAKIVILTQGKEGMAIFLKGEPQPLLIPTFAREVFDVSGAGDTVIAALALSLVSGADIVESALIANFAAGVEVGKSGTATVAVNELRDYIELIGYSRSKKTKTKNTPTKFTSASLKIARA